MATCALSRESSASPRQALPSSWLENTKSLRTETRSQSAPLVRETYKCRAKFKLKSNKPKLSWLHWKLKLLASMGSLHSLNIKLKSLKWWWAGLLLWLDTNRLTSRRRPRDLTRPPKQDKLLPPSACMLLLCRLLVAKSRDLHSPLLSHLQSVTALLQRSSLSLQFPHTVLRFRSGLNLKPTLNWALVLLVCRLVILES